MSISNYNHEDLIWLKSIMTGDLLSIKTALTLHDEKKSIRLIAGDLFFVLSAEVEHNDNEVWLDIIFNGNYFFIKIEKSLANESLRLVAKYNDAIS